MKKQTAAIKKFTALVLKTLKVHKFRFFRIALVALLLFLFPSPNIYYSFGMLDENPSAKSEINLPPAPKYPINFTNFYPQYLTAEGIVVLDVPSGIILYSKNSENRLSPASTTKIATALVAFDSYKLDDILEVKTIEGNGSSMGLVKGEKITFESLLYGLLVASANDAAVTLAENYPGGPDAFVGAMNKKVRFLKLHNTHFTNPTGFDYPGHYTSAQDLARLATVMLKDKTLAKIVATRAITVSDTSYTYFHDLKNVNQLLGDIPGVAGVKTGYTENAEECVVTLVKRDDHEVLTVVLRSEDRFRETNDLISWVFQNYKWVDIADYDKSIPTSQGK